MILTPLIVKVFCHKWIQEKNILKLLYYQQETKLLTLISSLLHCIFVYFPATRDDLVFQNKGSLENEVQYFTLKTQSILKPETPSTHMSGSK